MLILIPVLLLVLLAGLAVLKRIWRPVAVKMKGRDRNKPCPCGFGSKYKTCCGEYAK